MLYVHLFLFLTVILAVTLLCGAVALGALVAIVSVTGFPSSNTGYALVTAAFLLPLWYLVMPRCGRLFAKLIPGICPSCKAWGTRMLFTHPISYRCSACGKLTKLTVFLGDGLTQDCPKCGGHHCFEPTGSKIQSGPEELLAFRCKKCGHFGYGEKPPLNMA